MGNCLLTNCPITTGRLLSWSSIRATCFESVEDAAPLYASVTDNHGNTDTDALIVDKRPSSVCDSVQHTKQTKIFREYANFSFLTNDEIASWILNTRFMFIMRGPSGSGKSYLTECIRARFPTTKICSADNFWYLESGGKEYQFDASRKGEAHGWCQSLAREAVQSGTSPIVIDNTNIRVWETSPYAELARQFGYTVIMVSPQTPWRFDTEALAMRNVHLVPYEAVESMVRNFEPIFPSYYGLLWPGLGANIKEKLSTPQMSPLDIDGQNLMEWAWDAFTTLVSLRDVRIQLANAFGLSDSTPLDIILEHWQSATVPAFGGGRLTSRRRVHSPHVTLRYAAYGRAPGAQYYGLSGVVSTSLLGRLFTVQVTGLFVSPRTVGVRVRLPLHDPMMRQLWASEDQAELVSPLDEKNRSPPCPVPSEMPAGRPKPPSRPLGCRAHVTLALSCGVEAAETGITLLRVVDAELADRPGEHMAVLPSGSVRRVTVPQPAATSPSSDLASASINGGDHPVTCGLAPPGHEFVYILDLASPQHHRVLFAGAY